ncbi:hypothetical protein BWX39_00745 [Prevotella intermedia ATCC 25611 = DSM 20706]|nr:hypothetical protein BWX39_00745 [Prevotella intermedia ATCC 25611 = DSM 20706]
MLCDNLNKPTQLCDEPRKRLFCAAKPTLLPCKTAAFGMQNNRFYKALIIRLLYNYYTYEKYLHI